MASYREEEILKLPRKPKVENDRLLFLEDLKLFKVEKPERLLQSPFKRYDNGYYYEEYTCTEEERKTSDNYGYFRLSVQDSASDARNRVFITCETSGGMFGYEFNKFYKANAISDIYDLELQELILSRLMWFLDEGIFSLPEGYNTGREDWII